MSPNSIAVGGGGDVLFRPFKPVQLQHIRSKPRIIIFIGSLAPGGKERRLIEMLTYFQNKKCCEFLLVMSQDIIHYKDFYKLEIPYKILRRKFEKNNLGPFVEFYRICREFQPNLVHTWGRIQTFYALPAIIMQHIPLLNSQITSAPPLMKKWSVNFLIDRVNFYFSKHILSNSKAGIESYKPPFKKSGVIYNGINPDRFKNLPPAGEIRQKYGITTPYIVLMVASFSTHKDYDLFYNVAEYVTKKRKDITFIGVGGIGKNDFQYRELVRRTSGNQLILFPGRINDVEALINISTIGVLFSNRLVHGEGISNAIMEYMSLGKPVIANDAGGTREIVFNDRNGFLVTSETVPAIAALVNRLVDDPALCKQFGEESIRIIREHFLLEKMGSEFWEVYDKLLPKN